MKTLLKTEINCSIFAMKMTKAIFMAIVSAGKACHENDKSRFCGKSFDGGIDRL